MACLECARGFHQECMDNNEYEPDSAPCCCPLEPAAAETPIFSEVMAPIETVKRGRPVQEEIGTSAGRKRAAEIYGSEMGDNKPCEWRFMANCGGGLHPISGCAMGTREHIHHGPIKNTSHNERSNISLICTFCHNRWHGKNDSIYKEEAYGLLPKQPRLMSPEECFEVLVEELERKKKKKDGA